MKSVSLSVAVFQALSLVSVVFCYPTGVPAEACADIYPVGLSGSSLDLSTNPFQLSLSDFDESYGGDLYYVPGEQYTCESMIAVQIIIVWMISRDIAYSDPVRIWW